VLDRRGVTPFDAPDAFHQEHRRCGELDGGVDGCTWGWSGRVRSPRRDCRERVSSMLSMCWADAAADEATGEKK
jgi:hypothetical protein